jgi:hypothetical protein
MFRTTAIAAMIAALATTTFTVTPVEAKNRRTGAVVAGVIVGATALAIAGAAANAEDRRSRPYRASGQECRRWNRHCDRGSEWSCNKYERHCW